MTEAGLSSRGLALSGAGPLSFSNSRADAVRRGFSCCAAERGLVHEGGKQSTCLLSVKRHQSDCRDLVV